MRKRLIHHDREEAGPPQAAWTLALVALGCGLFLWIVWVFTIVSYDFARLREFWSTPGATGLSTFELAALVCLLFALLVILTIAAAWRSSDARPWLLLATHGASLSVVAAWGVNFYGMVTILLNDEWYYEAIVDEPYDLHRAYLGQVISTQPCDNCPDGTASLSVALETKKTVQVVASPTENPVGSIVAVNVLKGRLTGELRLEFDSSVEVDDVELFKRFWFFEP